MCRFHYMAVADNRQRLMPLPDDRLPGRGKELVPPEAVLLVNPIEPEFLGEVINWKEKKKLHLCDKIIEKSAIVPWTKYDFIFGGNAILILKKIIFCN